LFPSSSENPLEGATVVRFQVGLFRSTIGVVQEKPVHPRSRWGGIGGVPAGSRPGRQSGSLTDWLAAEEVCRQHRTAHLARPCLGCEHGPSVAIDTRAHDPLAQGVRISRRVSNHASLGVLLTRTRCDKPIIDYSPRRPKHRSRRQVFENSVASRKQLACKHQSLGT
jgi:hypothetical protein